MFYASFQVLFHSPSNWQSSTPATRRARWPLGPSGALCSLWALPMPSILVCHRVLGLARKAECANGLQLAMEALGGFCQISSNCHICHIGHIGHIARLWGLCGASVGRDLGPRYGARNTAILGAFCGAFCGPRSGASLWGLKLSCF